MSKKTRLDVLLVEQGLLDSRQKAQAHIMAGLVFVNGQRVDKPGTAVAERCADRGTGPRPPLCQPRRPEAGKGHENLSYHAGG